MTRVVVAIGRSSLGVWSGLKLKHRLDMDNGHGSESKFHVHVSRTYTHATPDPCRMSRLRADCSALYTLRPAAPGSYRAAAPTRSSLGCVAAVVTGITTRTGMMSRPENELSSSATIFPGLTVSLR